MRASRRMRRQLLTAMGVRSVEELRSLGASLTLSSLWRDLGWMRLLVTALWTDPTLPGEVRVQIRRPWRWLGSWALRPIARLVAWRLGPRLPIGIMLSVTR